MGRPHHFRRRSRISDREGRRRDNSGTSCTGRSQQEKKVETPRKKDVSKLLIYCMDTSTNMALPMPSKPTTTKKNRPHHHSDSAKAAYLNISRGAPRQYHKSTSDRTELKDELLIKGQDLLCMSCRIKHTLGRHNTEFDSICALNVAGNTTTTISTSLQKQPQP